VPHVPADRVTATPQSPSALKKRGPTTLHASIAGLHRDAGNRAVAGLLRAPAPGLVQRDVGWKSDGSTEGHAWNRDEHGVGKIRRIPVEGLSKGLQTEKATYYVRNPENPKEWIPKTESTKLDALSPEGATGKAIVLVPEALVATQPIEVVVFLHGYTEGTGRPYAGWRALSKPPPKDGPSSLRQGVDAGDTAPVRDVALDQAEAQLEETGQKQVVMVLPQGGLHSQFGKDGTANFDSDTYVRELVKRLSYEHVWMDGQGKPVKKWPAVARVSMAGHSGAGATLANMADESVKQVKNAGKPPDPKAKAPKSSGISGDLVIFDAINGPGELGSFQAWARMRLDQDLIVLKGNGTDKEKLDYLRTAPKLRGFYSDDGYKPKYVELDNDIRAWFKDNAKALGPFAAALRANFTIKHFAVGHEELMRGEKIGNKRAAGTGGIVEAIQSLHPPELKTPADAPPMPGPIK
jgi:hypothetical protein